MKGFFHISDPALVQDFFKDRLGLAVGEKFKGILWIPIEHLGKVRDMDHVAVAVGFDGWVGRTCCMHTVIQMPEKLNREMIRESFDYIFNTCQMQCVLGLVDSTNTSAVKFDTRLGFKEVHRISQGGIDGDLIVFSMTRADCRWLKEKPNGRQEFPSDP